MYLYPNSFFFAPTQESPSDQSIMVYILQYTIKNLYLSCINCATVGWFDYILLHKHKQNVQTVNSTFSCYALMHSFLVS